MKLNLGKRLVLFLHWLMSLIACALAVALCVWPESVQRLFNGLYGTIGKFQTDALGAVVLAVYALLAVVSAIMLFSNRRRGDHGFITVDSSDAGRTRIAVSAVEQMIRQAVRGVDGIAEMKSNIVNGEDAISIDVSVAIRSGAHVPTVTMNIQRAIRGYIELNCGVAVREVGVSVHALESAEEGAKHGRRRGAQTVEPTVPQAPAWQPPVTDLPVEEPAEAVPEVVPETISEAAEKSADEALPEAAPAPAPFEDAAEAPLESEENE